MAGRRSKEFLEELEQQTLGGILPRYDPLVSSPDDTHAAGGSFGPGMIPLGGESAQVWWLRQQRGYEGKKEKDPDSDDSDDEKRKEQQVARITDHPARAPQFISQHSLRNAAKAVTHMPPAPLKETPGYNEWSDWEIQKRWFSIVMFTCILTCLFVWVSIDLVMGRAYWMPVSGGFVLIAVVSGLHVLSLAAMASASRKQIATSLQARGYLFAVMAFLVVLNMVLSITYLSESGGSLSLFSWPFSSCENPSKKSFTVCVKIQPNLIFGLLPVTLVCIWRTYLQVCRKCLVVFSNVEIRRARQYQKRALIVLVNANTDAIMLTLVWFLLHAAVVSPFLIFPRAVISLITRVTFEIPMITLSTYDSCFPLFFILLALHTFWELEENIIEIHMTEPVNFSKDLTLESTNYLSLALADENKHLVRDWGFMELHRLPKMTDRKDQKPSPNLYEYDRIADVCCEAVDRISNELFHDAWKYTYHPKEIRGGIGGFVEKIYSWCDTIKRKMSWTEISFNQRMDWRFSDVQRICWSIEVLTRFVRGIYEEDGEPVRCDSQRIVETLLNCKVSLDEFVTSDYYVRGSADPMLQGFQVINTQMNSLDGSLSNSLHLILNDLVLNDLELPDDSADRLRRYVA